jgi:hypothetical protein
MIGAETGLGHGVQLVANNPLVVNTNRRLSIIWTPHSFTGPLFRPAPAPAFPQVWIPDPGLTIAETKPQKRMPARCDERD